MSWDKKSVPKLSIIIPKRGYAFLSKEIYRGHEFIISYDKGRGASWARNEGAYNATGDILLFFDDDVMTEKSVGKDMINIFLERDCIAVVASQDEIDIYKNLASIHFNNRIRYNHSLLPDYIDILYGSCCAILRTHFEPFDERITNVEDNELGMRLARKGKIYHAKDIKFTHAKHITLIGLLRNDYVRTLARVKLFLGRHMFTQVIKERRFITSPLYQLVSIVAWVNPLLFLIVNWGYLRYSRRKYGVWMAFQFYCLMILDMAVVSWAIVVGLMKGERYE